MFHSRLSLDRRNCIEEDSDESSEYVFSDSGEALFFGEDVPAKERPDGSISGGADGAPFQGSSRCGPDLSSALFGEGSTEVKQVTVDAGELQQELVQTALKSARDEELRKSDLNLRRDAHAVGSKKKQEQYLYERYDYMNRAKKEHLTAEAEEKDAEAMNKKGGALGSGTSSDEAEKRGKRTTRTQQEVQRDREKWEVLERAGVLNNLPPHARAQPDMKFMKDFEEFLQGRARSEKIHELMDIVLEEEFAWREKNQEDIAALKERMKKRIKIANLEREKLQAEERQRKLHESGGEK